ncbi:MAG: hypothetical protein WBB52_00955 [Acidimicrobiales bacterium]
MAGNETRDSAAESLTALADELEHSLGDAVTIDRWAVPGDGVTLTPTRNTALAVGWMDFGDEVYLETLGGPGGRWELRRSRQDIEWLESIVRSVIAGRVTEVFGPSRSQVTVTTEDGKRYSERGAVAGDGCIPLPFWTRWGQKVKYTPYLEDTPA